MTKRSPSIYVGKLGFTLVEDIYQPEQDKRWVAIRPPGAAAEATTILLARASSEHQAGYVGSPARCAGLGFRNRHRLGKRDAH